MYWLVLSAFPLGLISYMGVHIARKNIKRKGAFLSRKDRFIGA